MKLAVIPARGGSKRIPRKNIKLFCGKPIIAYSIQACIESALFDEIIVSTDDIEIADVAKQYGASVPFLRPDDLADDFTGTNDVVKHAIKWALNKNMPIEYACCVYATAPFLEPKYLVEGFERLVKTGTQFSFSITSFPFPIQRSIRITDDRIEPFYPEFISKRSQDIEDAYHDAGQFYWGTVKGFLDDVSIFSSASSPVRMPRHLVQDIDTTEDWYRAELMYQAWRMSDKKSYESSD